MPSMFPSTPLSHSFNWCLSVGPWSVYQAPAWLASRVVIDENDGRKTGLFVLHVRDNGKKLATNRFQVHFYESIKPMIFASIGSLSLTEVGHKAFYR